MTLSSKCIPVAQTVKCVTCRVLGSIPRECMNWSNACFYVTLHKKCLWNINITRAFLAETLSVRWFFCRLQRLKFYCLNIMWIDFSSCADGDRRCLSLKPWLSFFCETHRCSAECLSSLKHHQKICNIACICFCFLFMSSEEERKPHRFFLIMLLL